MRADNKIQILSVYDELCKRDPAWNHPKMLPQFRVLYDGWRAVELRHKKHAPYVYSAAWKRGWLSSADFDRFRRYALQ